MFSESGGKNFSIVPNPGGKKGDNIILESCKKMDLLSGKTINSVRLQMMDEAGEYSPGGFNRGKHWVNNSKSKYEISDSSSLESGVPSKLRESTSQFGRADSNEFSKSKSIVEKHK
jgi:hypothetical protein